LYLLNLLFDLTAAAQDKENGLFTSAAGAAPLANSRQWLHLIPDAGHPDDPTPPFDAESAKWEQVGGSNDAHLLLSKASNPRHVCVRIAPSVIIDPASTLSIFVTFGKPATAHQRHASPFTFNDLPAGRTIAAFQLHPGIPRNSGVGWFFPLKPIAKSPGIADLNVVHRYSFIVGARLTVPGPPPDVFTFGEDPEMDVSV
jgi:hypothetical protein